MKTGRDCNRVRWRADEVPGILLLKGPCTASLTVKLTHSELWHWHSSLKGMKDIHKETELPGFKVRDGGADVRHHCFFIEYFPQQRWKAGAIVPWLIHPYTHPQVQVGTKSECLSNGLIHFTSRYWFPETLPPPYLWSIPSLFQQLFHTNGLSQLTLKFSKISQKFINHKQAETDLHMPHISC